MTLSRTRSVLCVAALAAPLLCLAPSASAACKPTVTGYGPTITVQPDYQHPAKSQVGYDSSATDIEVNPCGS